jgi:hypothetical protein
MSNPYFLLAQRPPSRFKPLFLQQTEHILENLSNLGGRFDLQNANPHILGGRSSRIDTVGQLDGIELRCNMM